MGLTKFIIVFVGISFLATVESLKISNSTFHLRDILTKKQSLEHDDHDHSHDIHHMNKADISTYDDFLEPEPYLPTYDFLPPATHVPLNNFLPPISHLAHSPGENQFYNKKKKINKTINDDQFTVPEVKGVRPESANFEKVEDLVETLLELAKGLVEKAKLLMDSGHLSISNSTFHLRDILTNKRSSDNVHHDHDHDHDHSHGHSHDHSDYMYKPARPNHNLVSLLPHLAHSPGGNRFVNKQKKNTNGRIKGMLRTVVQEVIGSKPTASNSERIEALVETLLEFSKVLVENSKTLMSPLTNSQSPETIEQDVSHGSHDRFKADVPYNVAAVIPRFTHGRHRNKFAKRINKKNNRRDQRIKRMLRAIIRRVSVNKPGSAKLQNIEPMVETLLQFTKELVEKSKPSMNPVHPALSNKDAFDPTLTDKDALDYTSPD